MNYKFEGAISIESFCPRLDKWTLLKNMSGRRLQFGVAVMDDKLIIVGGRDGLKTMNSVRFLDFTFQLFFINLYALSSRSIV